MKKVVFSLVALLLVAALFGCDVPAAVNDDLKKSDGTFLDTIKPENAEPSPMKKTQAPIESPSPSPDVEPSIEPPQESPKADFLDDAENYKMLNGVLDNFKYGDFLKVINKYITDNKPDASDNAFKIKTLLDSAVPAIKKCKVNYDKFEGTSTVVYKGIESISKSINIVPSLESRLLNIRVGFKKSDWLFFDEVDIKVSDDIYVYESFESWDVERKVLSGGTIIEYGDMQPYDEDMEKLVAASLLTMRFSNSENDDKLDHKITDKELDAIKTIYIIAKTTQEFVDLTFYKH